MKMVLAIIDGLRLTLRHFFKRPITVSYPERRRDYSARFRGLHKLTRDEEGLEKCVGCGLCAKVCPSFAIEVVAAENTECDRHNRTERYAARYVIDIGRCIFCGYCVDACPVEALSMTPRYEMADYNREALYYTKSKMLPEVEPAGTDAAKAAGSEPAGQESRSQTGSEPAGKSIAKPVDSEGGVR